MAAPDAVAALAALVATERDRIARRWGRAAAALPGGDGRATTRRLATLVDDLARVLATRGAEGVPLWGEAARPYGGDAFEAGATAATLVRQLDALRPTLLHAWVTRYRDAPPPEVSAFVGELVAAAIASCVDDYVLHLRRSRLHMREEGTIESIVNHLDEGLIAVEADGTVSFVTPPAARVLGVDAADLAGLRREDAGTLLERLRLRDERERPLEAGELPYLQALATRQPVRGRFLRLRRPDRDEERIVETDAIPIFEPLGELRGVVETFRDRTAEYRQREALAAAYAELRRLHVRLLRRTRAQALGELAASVAGTLNNAMNAIRLRAQLAAQVGAAREHAAAIEAQVEEVARVIARLQELAAPRRRARAESVRLDDAVREALALVRPELAASAAGRDLHLTVDLRAGAAVLASPADVREIAVDLLLQAIEAAADEVWVRSSREDGRVRLVVAGIEPESLDTVAEAARAWGGDVTRRAADGLPAVVVELPAAPPAAPPPAPRRPAAEPRPPRAPAGPARTVLVVDDDDDQREMLATVLEARGLRVVRAATAAEAAARARDTRLDAALVDLAMPDRSGWDIVADLRRARGDVRAALVTGYEPAAAEPERGERVDAVFRKPVDLASLLRFLGHEP